MKYNTHDDEEEKKEPVYENFGDTAFNDTVFYDPGFDDVALICEYGGIDSDSFGGLCRSLDLGKTWEEIGSGPETVDASKNGRYVTGLERNRTTHLYISRDFGLTYKKSNIGRDEFE
jgi:hypothetical protein